MNFRTMVSIGTVLALGAPTAALGQHDDIALRSLAMEVCAVDGFGGYPSYEICVEQTYSEAVEAGRYRFRRINAVDPNSPIDNPGGLDCRGIEEGDYCRIVM